jgi:hypothetical protein
LKKIQVTKIQKELTEYAVQKNIKCGRGKIKTDEYINVIK